MAPPVDSALFDLDGCLYDMTNGLEEHVRSRIFEFMVARLGVEDVALAQQLWTVAFRRYNQSLRGLRAAGYALDTEEYWRFIRGDTARLLAPRPETTALVVALVAAGVRCWVYTNCREREAVEALQALGIPLSLFAGVLGADFQGGRCKPELASFQRVLAHTGLDPHRCIMFEDSPKNLATAKALGMRTILVGSVTCAEERGPACLFDAQVASCTLDEVRAAMPDLLPLGT